jgi:hypothetical protein
MFKRSTSENKWYHGKTPELQINILKLIVASGEVSKKSAAEILRTNYPDVSNSMKTLSNSKFIELSEKRLTTGHNYERFYKITERGLRALLTVKLDKEEFWKIITLLSIYSKLSVDEQEFELYFDNFEREFLGHSNIHGYFFLTALFDNIADNWLKLYSDTELIPEAQKVIEYLAFNGSSSLKNLVKETGASIKEINKFSVQNGTSKQNLSSSATDLDLQSESNVDANEIYSEPALSLLVSTRETKGELVYELTLFGVMVVIAIISYHFAGVKNVQSQRGISSTRISYWKPRLFFDNLNLKQYFDTIALNYRNKLPLIFGKWNLLKSQLGTMLYDSFDFMIYKSNRAHTIDETIWSFGTKEYYDEIQALAYNTIKRLRVIFWSGKAIINELENHQRWIVNNSRMVPVYNKLEKLNEIEVLAKYIDTVLNRNNNPFRELHKDIQRFTESINVKIIENMFKDEISFLFYMSLNTRFFPRSYKYPSRRSRIEDGMLVIPYEAREEDKEILKLGGSQQRLMAILSKDKDINQWFSTWIAGIIEYRQQTSKKMSEFYDRVTNAVEYSKERKPNSKTRMKASTNFWSQEYDMTKICFNDIESPLFPPTL